MAQEQLRILKDQVDAFVRDAKQKRDDKDRQFLMSSIGETIGKNLGPLMKTMADNTRLNRDDFVELVNYLKTELGKVEIKMPEIQMPNVYVPEPKVTVNVPPIKIPAVTMPDEMNVRGWVSLMGVDLNNPLPVQLRDASGNPVRLFENLTQIMGGGGGAFRTVNIGGIQSSAWGDVLNADGRLRVETNDSGATTGVRQVSGAVDSVVVNDVLVTVGVNQVSGANFSVSAGQAGEWRIDQVSGAVFSVAATDLDIRDLVNATDSISVYQVSGANWSVNANIGLSDTELRASSIPISQVSGANFSVSVSENKAEDAAHASGDTGFMALSVRNSTNTTFAADGDYAPISTDGIGRVMTRPVQTRGLLQTAYVSLTTGTETTLLAGAAATYFDLIHVIGTNNSDVAVTVDLRSATGGGIITSIRIPANGTSGISSSVPTPQDVAADTWTADLPDITGTTVTLSALFSREV